MCSVWINISCQNTLSLDKNKVMFWGIKHFEEYMLHSVKLIGLYCLILGFWWGENNDELLAAFVILSTGRKIPLHLAGVFAVEIRLPFCTCKGSQRAVGFPVTPASLLRGGWDHQDSEKSASLQLGDVVALWDVLGRHPLLIHRSRSFASGTAALSFWLRTGVPGEKAGQLEEGIPAARIWQGQGLRSWLFSRTLLWHRKELRSFSGEGRGRGTVRAAACAGWQWGLWDGDGRGEGANLKVGGFLCGALILSYFLHGHVCWEEGITHLEYETGLFGLTKEFIIWFYRSYT